MPTNLLKDNIDTLAHIITDIINTSLQSGRMNHAIITPIIKKRGIDVNLHRNYRPISSMSVVSNTLERYVALELRRYLDVKCLNDPFQSAYHPGHSTETAIERIHDLLLSIDSRRSVLLVLLDLTAAFDIWFDHPLPRRPIQFSENTPNNIISTNAKVQRTVLGPILFNIYISPIADIFRRHQIRYHIYADDTQLHVYAECPPSNHTDALRHRLYYAIVWTT